MRFLRFRFDRCQFFHDKSVRDGEEDHAHSQNYYHIDSEVENHGCKK